MQYDPIKSSLGRLFNRTPRLRIIFYKLLDLLLLRTWHIKKEVSRWASDRKGKQILLDAGSGFGQYAYYLSGINPVEWSLDAVDVKEDQIADCNRFFEQIGRTNVNFSVADLVKFSKPDTYDFILSVDVMEHILEDEQVFRNFYDSLTQEGILLISTPSDQGGSDVHDHEEETSFIDEHVREGYSVSEIRMKLKRAGFSKTEVQYAYGKPGQLSWRLSMKYPIMMLTLTKALFILLPFYYLVTFPFCLLLNYLDVHNYHTTGTGLIVKAYK
jgi:SAM-dependent methyltransferase